MKQELTGVIIFLFPLGKFKYMGVYLRWFYRKNFRKYVNIPPAIFGCKVY